MIKLLTRLSVLCWCCTVLFIIVFVYEIAARPNWTILTSVPGNPGRCHEMWTAHSMLIFTHLAGQWSFYTNKRTIKEAKKKDTNNQIQCLWVELFLDRWNICLLLFRKLKVYCPSRLHGKGILLYCSPALWWDRCTLHEWLSSQVFSDHKIRLRNSDPPILPSSFLIGEEWN